MTIIKNEVTSRLRVYKVPRVLFKPALRRMYIADQEPSNRSRNQLPVGEQYHIECICLEGGEKKEGHVDISTSPSSCNS